MADQKAGQIVGLLFGRKLSGQAERARAENGREHARTASVARDADAAQKRCGVGPLRRNHRAAENRVIAQRGEHFAGHECVKTFDTAAAHDGPLRVRAGQADQFAGVVRRGGLARGFAGQRAEDLRFLAAHHVRQFAAFEHAGDDVDRRAARSLHAHDAGDERIGVRRCVDVRRFDPALRAADHARRDDRQIRAAVEPGAACGDS